MAWTFPSGGTSITGSSPVVGDGLELEEADSEAFNMGAGSEDYIVVDTVDDDVIAKQHLKITDDVTGGKEFTVGGLAYANSTVSSAQLGTVENTEVLFDRTYTLKAGTLKVGGVLAIRACVFYSATNLAETHVLKVKCGATILHSTGNQDPANSDFSWFDTQTNIRTVGVAGTQFTEGGFRRGAAAANSQVQMIANSTGTIDTTIDNIIGISITRQVGSADTDSARLEKLTVIYYPPAETA